MIVDGAVFSRLTVIGIASMNPRSGRVRSCVRCQCGNELIVDNEKLRSGNTRSCGCLKIEKARALNYRHGAKVNRKPTAEYESWQHAKQRCFDSACPDFKNYGGRGISMCVQWRDDFAAFLAYVGPRPDRAATIDRIDCNGDYEPGNVRWAPRAVQNSNTRRNRFVVANGLRMTVAAAARLVGINPSTLDYHLRKNVGAFTVRGVEVCP